MIIIHVFLLKKFAFLQSICDYLVRVNDKTNTKWGTFNNKKLMCKLSGGGEITY